MGIFVDKQTRAIVQGITGTQGTFHTRLMLNYGTQIVAGVTPGKGGTQVHGLPVYDTVKEATENHDANASIIFVPAPFASEAAFEAMEASLKTIVIVTEHIPIKDAIRVMAEANGIIAPGECKLGIMPVHVFKPGIVGVASRSGTLTYEIAAGITAADLGQSTCMGLGGDPIIGLSFVEALRQFEKDEQTKAVALIGEIGGNLEELAAEFIATEGYEKPVVAYVAGRTAPPGKRMGHAGAIVMGRTGTAMSKIEAFKKAGVPVAEKPSEVAKSLSQLLMKEKYI